VKRMLSRVRTAARILRTEGFRSLVHRATIKVSRDIVEQARVLPVRAEDLLAVDPSSQPGWRATPLEVSDRSTVMSWVMSPPSPNSGGHQNLFRFIHAAERAGHRCHVYFYTATNVVVDPREMRAMLQNSGNYPHVEASMQMYSSETGVAAETQAVFATGWETAYPVFRDASAARRFYFVQDFEPAFYPWGSEYLLAEDTYRFGFHGLTAGGWLARKLHEDYGMPTGHFDFSVDHAAYRRTNENRRNEVFFYARPSTPRRGFEIGIAALGELHRLRPGVPIHLAGEVLTGRALDFPVTDHGPLGLGELSDLYNRCATALVVSATNMSLLPLELLACGVIPVVNDAPNNRLVSDNPWISYAPARPRALAEALAAVVDDPQQQENAARAAQSVAAHSWDDSGNQFLDAYARALHV